MDIDRITGPGMNVGNTAHVAIVGGTGAYEGADGQGDDRETGSKGQLHLHLLRYPPGKRDPAGERQTNGAPRPHASSSRDQPPTLPGTRSAEQGAQCTTGVVQVLSRLKREVPPSRGHRLFGVSSELAGLTLGASGVRTLPQATACPPSLGLDRAPESRRRSTPWLPQRDRWS